MATALLIAGCTSAPVPGTEAPPHAPAPEAPPGIIAPAEPLPSSPPAGDVPVLRLLVEGGEVPGVLGSYCATAGSAPVVVRCVDKGTAPELAAQAPVSVLTPGARLRLERSAPDRQLAMTLWTQDGAQWVAKPWLREPNGHFSVPGAPGRYLLDLTSYWEAGGSTQYIFAVEVRAGALLAPVTMEAIKAAWLERHSPDQPRVDLAPVEGEALLRPVVAAYNGARQVRPRDVGTTPPFTLVLELQAGDRISLSYVGGETVLASVREQALFIDSEELARALEPLGQRFRRP